MHKDFITGETKYVDLDVISRDGKEFAITSATWALESPCGIVDQGSAVVDGKRVSVLLTAPEKTGKYTLTVYYTIPPETIGARVTIDVH